MKLEHRKQKVVPLNRFVVRVLRYMLFAFALILISLAIGIFGYHYICDLCWIDSLYMSAMILTGMGPVSEITTVGGKLFSSFYALYSGVAFLSITAVFFAPLVHRVLHILQVEPEKEND
jgi:hypothetical protein